MKVFTFWEGQMPEYIKMCMETWPFDYTVLTYDNLSEYTSINKEGLKTFTLPQVSDAVRAHVLRDNGGHWLDADTIMLTNKLPEENVIGDPKTRTHSTGVLHYTDSAKQFFEEWVKYQDNVIADPNHIKRWYVLVNAFTDTHIPEHKEITIYPIEKCRPELTKIQDGDSKSKYVDFYFTQSYKLADIQPIDFLVLHNSWTPDWYKKMSRKEVLEYDCTMSNVLKEIL